MLYEYFTATFGEVKGSLHPLKDIRPCQNIHPVEIIYTSLENYKGLQLDDKIRAIVSNAIE